MLTQGRSLLCLAASTFALNTALAEPTLIRLGANTSASTISADGTVVFGGRLGPLPRELHPIRWSIENGKLVAQDMAFPEGVYGFASRVSENGNAAAIRTSVPSVRTTQWRAPNTALLNPLLPEWSLAYSWAVSPDGAWIYGSALSGGTSRAVRWSAKGGPEYLPLPEGAISTSANFTDENGAVYVGASFDFDDHRMYRFSGGFFEHLVTFPVVSPLSSYDVYDVSGDGLTLAGSRYEENAPVVWIWRASEGFTKIAELNPRDVVLYMATNSDGSAVFIQPNYFDSQTNEHSLVWTPDVGLRSTDEYLVELGVDLGGLTHFNINRVSADGRRYVGHARNESQQMEGVIITLDEACVADFNADDAVNSQDFFDFLTCFFDASCDRADMNDDDAVNSQDFFDFLDAFFAGC